MHVADISSPFVVQFTDSDAHPPMTVPIAIAAETGNHSGIGWRTKYSSDYGRCYSLEIEQEGICHTNIFCFDHMLIARPYSPSQVITKWISKMRLKSKRPVEYLMHHPGQFMELDTTSRVRENLFA